MAIENIDLLKYIHNFQNENGASPTIREIGERFGMKSTAHVTYRLERLEGFGWIERTPYLARMIRITDKGRSQLARR